MPYADIIVPLQKFNVVTNLMEVADYRIKNLINLKTIFNVHLILFVGTLKVYSSNIFQ